MQKSIEIHMHQKDQHDSNISIWYNLRDCHFCFLLEAIVWQPSKFCVQRWHGINHIWSIIQQVLIKNHFPILKPFFYWNAVSMNVLQPKQNNWLLLRNTYYQQIWVIWVICRSRLKFIYFRKINVIQMPVYDFNRARWPFLYSLVYFSRSRLESFKSHIKQSKFFIRIWIMYYKQFHLGNRQPKEGIKSIML